MHRVLLITVRATPAFHPLLYGLIEHGAGRGWDVRACEQEPGLGRTIAAFAPDAVVEGGDLNAAAVRALPPDLLRMRFRQGDSDLPFVGFDEQACGAKAAGHLLACGYRHFAFAGSSLNPAARARYASFRRSVESAGFSVVSSDLTGSLSPWVTHGELLDTEELLTWLRNLPKPVGIFCPSDISALGLLTNVRRAGFRVPEEIGVLGAGNDASVCDLVAPGVSSVSMPYRRLGLALGEALEACFRDRRRRPRVLVTPDGVVQRGSTRITSAHDPTFAGVFRHIRENLAQPLRVTQLAAMTGLPRRAFELRFRQETGRTPLQDILRLRLEKAAELLQTSSQTLAEIATACGFSSAFHLSSAFSKQYSLSPLAFRRSGPVRPPTDTPASRPAPTSPAKRPHPHRKRS